MSWLDDVGHSIGHAAKSVGKTVKKAVNQTKQNFKHLGSDINWNKWGQDVLVGGLTGAVGLGVKHNWLGKAFQALSGVKGIEEAMNNQAEAIEKAAAMTKSQPTANASLVAGAAAEQSANRGATDEGVYNANKRRRTLQSTARRNNVLGTSGGMMGRATLG